MEFLMLSYNCTPFYSSSLAWKAPLRSLLLSTLGFCLNQGVNSYLQFSILELSSNFQHQKHSYTYVRKKFLACVPTLSWTWLYFLLNHTLWGKIVSSIYADSVFTGQINMLPYSSKKSYLSIGGSRMPVINIFYRQFILCTIYIYIHIFMFYKHFINST
jgi:hypothetical protein